MAINLNNQYTNSEPATPDYPFGSIKNATAPGLLDGTPLDKVWKNDHLGFLQGILQEAGITPNDIADTAQVSQYKQAIKRIISYDLYESTINYPAGARVVGSDGYRYISTEANGPGSTIIDPTAGTSAWLPAEANGYRSVAGGGKTLSSFTVNRIADSLQYTLPAISSVPINGWLIIEKRDSNYINTPSFITSGSDVLVDRNGTDPDNELIMDVVGSEWVRLVSNGVNAWIM